MDLHDSFGEFCQNKLSISAGIGMFDMKYPVALMAREAGVLEECSKAYPGKDAITIFDKTQTYSWERFINGVLEEKYAVIQEFFESQGEEMDEKRGKNFLYNLLELMRNREEKINLARFVYVLSRMEPKGDEEGENGEKVRAARESYRKFAKKMYEWIGDKEACREAMTAIYLYVYSIREKEEDAK